MILFFEKFKDDYEEINIFSLDKNLISIINTIYLLILFVF